MAQQTPSQQQTPVFSAPLGSSSYKRRSLQSPFILNDLSGAGENGDDDRHVNDNCINDNDHNDECEFGNDDGNDEGEGEGEGEGDGSTFIKDSHDNENTIVYNYEDDIYRDDDVSSDKLVNLNLEDTYNNDTDDNSNNKNIYNPFNFTMTPSNPSMVISGNKNRKQNNKHRHQRSTASITYTPPNLHSPLPPPSLQGCTNSANSSPSSNYQPFQFNSMMMNNSTETLSIPSTVPLSPSKENTYGQVLPKPSYRRGHRYKHSSVSMNMFQDSNKLNSMNDMNGGFDGDFNIKSCLPQKYEIPTRGQVFSMTTFIQKKKFAVVLLESLFVVISYYLGFEYGNGCLGTLSHILFYDFISNLSILIVSIMSNFEIWGSSSLKYPFGLGRIDVLMKFALSVSLMFVGLDLFSHIFEEILINTLSRYGENDEAHERHMHSHSNSGNNGKELNPFFYEIFVLLTMVISILAAHIVNNNKKIIKEVRNNEMLDSENCEKDDDGKYKSGTTKMRKKSIFDNNINNNSKRLSSITLKEPIRESISERVMEFVYSKFGINLRNVYKSTTMLTIMYASYSLYYPIAQKLSANFDETKGNEDEVSDLINMISTIIIAIIVSLTGWKMIWNLGNILLLRSPSRNGGGDSNAIDNKGYQDVEHVIAVNVEQLDVFKTGYVVEEVKVSQVNLRLYIIIMKMSMHGSSDDDEAKLRFYSMRLIKGIMHQAVRGGLKRYEESISQGKSKPDQDSGMDNEISVVMGMKMELGIEAENRRKTLIDLLNAASVDDDTEETQANEVFEITIDVDRR